MISGRWLRTTVKGLLDISQFAGIVAIPQTRSQPGGASQTGLTAKDSNLGWESDTTITCASAQRHSRGLFPCTTVNAIMALSQDRKDNRRGSITHR